MANGKIFARDEVRYSLKVEALDHRQLKWRVENIEI